MGITAPVKIIVFRVGSMDNRFACEHARHDAPRSGWSRTASKLGKGDRRSPNGYGTHPLALGNYKFAERRLAKTHRLLQHCIEHRGEIAGRGIDNLQDLGGGGLLFACIDEFALERVALGGACVELAL